MFYGCFLGLGSCFRVIIVILEVFKVLRVFLSRLVSTDGSVQSSVTSSSELSSETSGFQRKDGMYIVY